MTLLPCGWGCAVEIWIDMCVNHEVGLGIVWILSVDDFTIASLIDDNQRSGILLTDCIDQCIHILVKGWQVFQCWFIPYIIEDGRVVGIEPGEVAERRYIVAY